MAGISTSNVLSAKRFHFQSRSDLYEVCVTDSERHMNVVHSSVSERGYDAAGILFEYEATAGAPGARGHRSFEKASPVAKLAAARKRKREREGRCEGRKPLSVSRPEHSEAPPPPTSPLAWGDPSQVDKLLENAFELKFEKGISNAYHSSVEDIWDWYTRGFGPLRQLVETLPPDRVERLKEDIDAYHRRYAVPAGLHVKREYLLTIGRRRK